MQRAIDDRMSLSEAIEAAGRIVGCYPNGGANAGGGYVGALAETLRGYPRGTAVRCADKARGIMRECKFLPTVADVVAWCERESWPLYEAGARERRIEQQMADREHAPPSAESIARVEEMRLDCMRRLDPGQSDDEIEKREARAAAERKRRMAEVRAEWGDAPAPTIAGFPVSKELANLMCAPAADPQRAAAE